jgi:hypothetical protein
MRSNSRVTGNSEVMHRNQSHCGPEVLFEEIAIDLLRARFWIVSALPSTHRELDQWEYAIIEDAPNEFPPVPARY